MKLKSHIDFRKSFVVLYFLCFVIYVVVGLQPAEATNYEISSKLMIPSINFYSDVTDLELINNMLDTPDSIVGSYSENKNKTLLIGHKNTVFQNLDGVMIGDVVNYGGVEYSIVKARLATKESIDMEELLEPTKLDTIVIMTCAGKDLGNGDATHRLIITAEAL